MPLSTAVHCKETNSEECLNYNSVAPDQYKSGVIKTFLHRAYKICNNWFTLHQEIERIRRLLTNNNFPMQIIDNAIHKFIEHKHGNLNNQPQSHINLYYRNQMSSRYKQEENNLRRIIEQHISPTSDNDQIKLSIYYKNQKVKNLFIKNNNHKTEKKETSHVVYEYKCPREECQPSTCYIGYTECSLEDRMRNHTQSGSIQQHSKEHHNKKLTTNEILQDITIRRKFHSKEDLIIAESLLIKDGRPTLNAQREGEARVLFIF